MRALVIFESMYGNTQAIANAIADGLRSGMSVEVLEVGAAPTVIAADVDLLVVGGPTHAHGMSKVDTRRSAAKQAHPGPVSNGIGMREWFAIAGVARKGVAAAAFDTRIKGPGLLWGSAAKGANGELRRLGARTIVPPESFLVSGPMGPVYEALVDGEVDRARAWGERLVGAVAKPAVVAR